MSGQSPANHLVGTSQASCLWQNGMALRTATAKTARHPNQTRAVLLKHKGAATLTASLVLRPGSFQSRSTIHAWQGQATPQNHRGEGEVDDSKEPGRGVSEGDLTGPCQNEALANPYVSIGRESPSNKFQLEGASRQNVNTK